MLKGVCIEAGLGDPPVEYVNNDPEAANFMIKHGLHFDPKKPHHFIEEIKNIVQTQHRNEDRAVFGRGPYKVKKEFQYLTVDDLTWGRLTHEQRMRKLSAFLMTGMDDKDVIRKETANHAETPSSSALSLTARESGITTIPVAILEALFDKAANLVSTSGSVVPKPGASDESFMVVGVSNKVHSVSPGKGGSLSCDRSCVNHSTKICEHTLAVAQLNGTLPEFVAWDKRSKRGLNISSMAAAGGPKSAGRKPSKRKRSNAKTQPVLQQIDLLQHKSGELPPEGPSNSEAVSSQYNIAGPSVPLQSNSQYSSNQISSGQHLPIQNGAFLRQAEAQISLPPSHQYVLQSAHTGIPHALPATNGSTFLVKWLMGTRVSRCYGCGGVIQNPPLNCPDDLIVVYRDIRQFRHRITGQLTTSTEPQNVHFHLHLACVRARYPHFVPNSLTSHPILLIGFAWSTSTDCFWSSVGHQETTDSKHVTL